MDATSQIKENFLSSIKTSIKNINSFKNLPAELKKDHNFIINTLAILKRNQAYVGQYEDKVDGIIKELNIDKSVALNLVQSEGFLLCRLPEKFKSDEEIVFAAVNNYAFALIYASKESKDNKKIVLEAVKVKPDVLEVVSKRLLDDEEVILTAVKTDGTAIAYASLRLLNNKEIILEAVKTNIHALQYLGEDLVNDKEIALEAYKTNQMAKRYFSKELNEELKDKEIIPYLESAVLAEKLRKDLSEEKPQAKKVKI